MIKKQLVLPELEPRKLKITGQKRTATIALLEPGS
jgi:hypothetical protein